MMQRLSVRAPGNHAGERVESDRHGRLYDPVVRESLAKIGDRANVEPLEAIAALRLASGRVHAAIERWTESHGLSESRLRVLMALYYAPDSRLPLGALAEALDVVPRTITDVVDVLERDGLIRRIPAQIDRRSVHAALTPAGRARFESMRRDVVARQTALFGGLDRSQMAELRHLCLLVVQQLQNAKGGA